MRVLVAEDDPDLRLMVGRMLSRLGHDAEIVADGEALLRRAADGPPDAVLSDIGMPWCDGLRAGARLRRELPGLRVVLMTGDSSLAEEARRAGFTRVLSKPFSLEELEGALSSF